MTFKIKRSKGLEIEPEAQYFNQIFLEVQRFGFIIMALLIIAALLGLFGSGWMSHTTTVAGDLKITYQKFIRQQAVTILNIHFQKCETQSVISISKRFFENVSIKSINPTPYKEVIDSDSIQYAFFCDKLARNIEITFIIEPEKFGILQGIVAVGQNKVALNQFVYP